MARRGAWTPARNNALLANLGRLPTNPSNTSVLMWGNQLLALAEGGPPLILDPGSLDTIGEENFKSGLGLLSFFSAHPKLDAESGELFSIGIEIGLPFKLNVFKFLPTRPSVVAQKCSLALQNLTFLHDFAMTKKHIVILIPPWICPLNALAKTASGGALVKEFEWREELGNRLVVLRRSDLSVVVDQTVRPPFSFYHTINAFDEDESSLKLQVAVYSASRLAVEANFSDMYKSSWSDETRCSMREFRVDLVTGDLVESRGSIAPTGASTFELPSIHPAWVGRENRYVFTNAAFPSSAPFMNCVERLDLRAPPGSQGIDRATFGEACFAGEAMVLPRVRPDGGPQGELDAYIATCVYDSEAHTSFWAILDAANLAAGPLARIKLPTHVPYSFHGTWVPDETYILKQQSDGSS
ncbi:unnamed protein product [Polarella glacialis]|uniref:Uncharacterized protein n=1 Tax=Polarella glacialis TaxID=89957 RepID=A0A813FJS3_POLGL|nr:unnamed protein product [Polarella glacialis]